MARKSKADEWLTPDGLLRVKGWARDGLTDKVIAEDKIGISEWTFYDWMRRYPQFSQAIKEGKAPVDITVEDALLTSSLGQYVTVREPIKLKTKRQLKDKGTIEEERIEYVERQIYIPPNVTAQIFWCKNRRPDKWRDKPSEVNVMENGKLFCLIDGLKEPVDDDIYAEAAGVDGAVEDE